MDRNLLLCYPKCSTCRNAKKWLADQAISFEERNIAQDNPTVQELDAWQQKSGLPLKRFFNTSGQVYRGLAIKDKRPEMSREEQLTLLATDGMLVKRPLLILADRVLVGFRQQAWEEALLR